MKVGIEEWSENSKDRGHLAKNEAVGKLIKIKAIHHEICKTVTKNFPDLWLAHNSVGNSMVVIWRLHNYYATVSSGYYT